MERGAVLFVGAARAGRHAALRQCLARGGESAEFYGAAEISGGVSAGEPQSSYGLRGVGRRGHEGDGCGRGRSGSRRAGGGRDGSGRGRDTYLAVISQFHTFPFTLLSRKSRKGQYKFVCVVMYVVMNLPKAAIFS